MKKVVKLLTVVSLFAALSFAQNFNSSSMKDYDGFVTNLKESLKSENAGVQKSSIKLAGIHKVKEVVNELEEMLEETKDEKTKVLIAVSLFEIGKKSSIKKMLSLAEEENSLYLKNFYNTLYKIYTDKTELTSNL